MAKGQQRSNKEIKKPKKAKAAPVATPALPARNQPVSIGSMKKRPPAKA